MSWLWVCSNKLDSMIPWDGLWRNWFWGNHTFDINWLPCEASPVSRFAPGTKRVTFFSPKQPALSFDCKRTIHWPDEGIRISACMFTCLSRYRQMVSMSCVWMRCRRISKMPVFGILRFRKKVGWGFFGRSDRVVDLEILHLELLNGEPQGLVWTRLWQHAYKAVCRERHAMEGFQISQGHVSTSLLCFTL